MIAPITAESQVLKTIFSCQRRNAYIDVCCITLQKVDLYFLFNIFKYMHNELKHPLSFLAKIRYDEIYLTADNFYHLKLT